MHIYSYLYLCINTLLDRNLFFRHFRSLIWLLYGGDLVSVLMLSEIKALDYRVSGAGANHQVGKEPSTFSASFELVPYAAGNLLMSCQDCLVKLSIQGVAGQDLKSAPMHTYIHRKNCLPNKRKGIFST